jgi:hypothetical protein
MKAKRDRSRIDLANPNPELVKAELARGIEMVEAQRVEGLQALRRGQQGKLRVLERDLRRAQRKQDAPLARALQQRIAAVNDRVAELDRRAARSCRDWPEPREDAWIVHGFVQRAGRGPVAGATVAILDQSGRPLADGMARTEKDGYYRITVQGSAERPPEIRRLEQEKGRGPDQLRAGVTLEVREGTHLVYRHPEPLAPRPGAVTYLDVWLDDGDDCGAASGSGRA